MSFFNKCCCCGSDETTADVFASYHAFQQLFQPGDLLPFFPGVTDPTGHITASELRELRLEPGYYLITYSVSVLFRTANYLRISPSYNGARQIESEVYFAAAADRSSADGTASFIVHVPTATTFTLTYEGSGTATEGTLNLTILRLHRSE